MFDKELDIAINASLIAGKSILEVYKNEKIDSDLKSDLSPLTLADKNSHDEIVKILEKTGLPILSEEGKNISFEERKNWKMFWLVDPLDGTKEFIKKNGDFTVNIALIEDNKPVLGVIYVPVTKEIYFAAKGRGAFISKLKSEEEFNYNTAIKLPIKIKRDSYVIVASRSHLNDETKEYISKIEQKKENVELLSRGSSLKICMVAEGKADIYPRFGPTMEWDVAAGHAIAIEAGCSFTQSDEQTPIKYNKENLLNPYFIVKMSF